jgi:hypothetical protein
MFSNICAHVFLTSSIVYFDTGSLSTTCNGFAIIESDQLLSFYFRVFFLQTFRLSCRPQQSDRRGSHILLAIL